MFELSNVLNALKTIWALVGCLVGFWFLFALVESLIEGFIKKFGGKKRNEN